MALHDDELAVDTTLVRRLLEQQMPAYAGLRLAPLEVTGSTNALFRLGDDLLVRLPRQPGGSGSIAKEARWSPLIATAVTVPEVVAVGEPGAGYPERWSVVRWTAGRRPVAGAGGAGLARDLAAAVSALHALEVPARARDDTSLRWYRGKPLAAFDADFRRSLDQCRTLPDLDLPLDRAERIWAEAVAQPAADPAAPRWLHADLLCENLLVHDGRLAGVLDLGALCLGDPAVDHIAAWEALDSDARQTYRDAVAVDEAEWLRGRAWALAVALMTLPYYRDTMPERCADRLVMARAVLAEAAEDG